MVKNKEEIKKDIEAFKLEHGGGYPDYYIGITNDPGRRMNESLEIIQEHLKQGEFTTGNPLYEQECESRDDAVQIERYFQHKDRGMLEYNSHSVGKETSKYIYCYKMTEDNKKAVLNESSPIAKEIKHSQKTMRFDEFTLKNKK